MREFTPGELSALAQGLVDLNKSVLLKSSKADSATAEKLLKSDLAFAHDRLDALEDLLDSEMYSYEVSFLSYEGGERGERGEPVLKTYIIAAKSPIEALQEFERSIPGKFQSMTALGATLIAFDFPPCE